MTTNSPNKHTTVLRDHKDPLNYVLWFRVHYRPQLISLHMQNLNIIRTTTFLGNLEISGNITAVREMSGKVLSGQLSTAYFLGLSQCLVGGLSFILPLERFCLSFKVI